MTSSLAQIDAAEQDLGSRFALPPKPGSALLVRLAQEQQQRVFRPAYRVAAPRLQHVWDALRPRVALWISDWRATHVLNGQLDTRDLAQLRKLTAAALHDVGGLTQAATAEWINGVSVDRAHELFNGAEPHGHVDTRPVREVVREGRDLWARTAAWPWWPIAQEATLDGGLPDGWHELPAVQSSWRLWAAGRDAA